MNATQIGFNLDYAEAAPTLEQLSDMDGYALLEFGTPWCGHCQAATDAVREALADYATMPHVKVYDGKGKVLGRKFRVKLWPTLILLHKGEEVARVVRPLQADEVREMVALSAVL